MFRHILVPFDASQAASHAFDLAADLARLTGARLTVLSVAQVPELSETVGEVEDATQRAQGFLQVAMQRLLARAELKGIPLETRLEAGHPADRILAFAEQNQVDLIVMGRRGLSGVARWVLGSVSDRVLQHAPCPVLVVR